ERHQERIHGYLLGMVREPAVADDLFQETFLRAIRAMHAQRGSYAHQGRWLQWVMRIARNAALDHLRRQKRWRTVESADEDREPVWERLPDTEPDAVTHIDRKQQIELLNRCINRLPPEQREVVLLRQEAELTFREIAELTDCSINTALGRMRYAVNNLRKMMVVAKKNDAEYAPY
ncbi:MAG: sigma-70 family RNA polymerase sigma factor, partial [Pseudomonadota bacterium]